VTNAFLVLSKFVRRIPAGDMSIPVDVAELKAIIADDPATYNLTTPEAG
jgi:hypothetical protein